MKPSDFFIGVIDFFSVMLPGALLTYFLSGMFSGDVFGEGEIFTVPATEAAKWMVFLLVAYIVGNLVFMLASFIDFTYDRILRKALFQSEYDLKYETARQIQWKLVKTDALLRELLLAERITKPVCDEIKDKRNHEILNTFKWSQHFLLFNKPEALASIQRTEADSKFFRSLVVTFLVIAILMFWQEKIPLQERNFLAVIFIVLALLCYYRYGDLRFKASEKAYEMVITFFCQKPEEPMTNPDFSHKPGEENKPQSISVLKSDLTEDFSTRHHELVSFLTKGTSKQPKRITIGQGESGKKVFISDKNESWFCVQGRGILHTAIGDESAKTILIPHAIVSLAKGSEFSVSNGGNQPLEILSLEN